MQLMLHDFSKHTLKFNSDNYSDQPSFGVINIYKFSTRLHIPHQPALHTM
jgi:hypothetical protein